MAQGVDLTVVIGTFAGMLAGFYGIAQLMLKQAAKDRKEDRDERLHLARAIDKMAQSTEDVAKATIKSADEARIRNGHLAEQHAEIAKSVEHVVKALKDK